MRAAPYLLLQAPQFSAIRVRRTKARAASCQNLGFTTTDRTCQTPHAPTDRWVSVHAH